MSQRNSQDAAVPKSNTTEQTLPPANTVRETEPTSDRTIPPSGVPNNVGDTESGAELHQTIQPDRSATSIGQSDPPVAERFGDYEILKEIARGGMGVVYRARQVSLNRTVALKKILSGQLAGDEDLKRFQIEAEAAGQLDHVGIVPVYDFGQVDGQYYFSMGFVEGDDLAYRIRDRPMEAEAAAAMMIKIAQAVGYANAKGVIHRDLKPSNVLLDTQNEPKVTDFGVAKQQGNESEMTAQGQIIGTPSYMPPEQAAGQGDEVDQRSDVYALGAILYALLTGRPPFQAATAMETMIQVLDQEPVPVSQLNASIPRDLETICLKCLQKEPAKRYVSAETLAEDLQRYLDDEPIVARPPTRAEQLGRWVRKNKATAIGTGLVAGTLIVATLVSVSFAIEASRQRDLASDQRDAAESAEAKAREQANIAEAQTELAEKQRVVAEDKTAEAQQKAKDLQTIVDFQSEQVSGIDVEGVGASFRNSLLSELGMQPEEVADGDFTGMALQILDRHIFRPTLKSIDSDLADQPLVQSQLLQMMAETYIGFGLIDEANAPLTRALLIRTSELGPEHPSTLESTSSMGRLTWMRGKYEEAVPYFTEALETRTRILGEEHPETLESLHNMGVVLRKMGDFEGAMKYLSKALEARRRVLGDEAFGTLETINMTGVLLFENGRSNDAAPFFEEALAARRKVLGEDHPSTLESFNNMGALFKSLRKYKEATPYLAKALEGRKRSLGSDHPMTVLSMKNMGMNLASQRRFDEAFPFFEEALETHRRTLGENHPMTLSSVNAMGGLLMNLRRYEEAEFYFLKAVEGRRRVLGNEHPYTFRTVHSLSTVLVAQEKFVEAEIYLQEILGSARRALGVDHRLTKETIKRLVTLHEKWHQSKPDAGHDAKAREFRQQFGGNAP